MHAKQKGCRYVSIGRENGKWFEIIRCLLLTYSIISGSFRNIIPTRRLYLEKLSRVMTYTSDNELAIVLLDNPDASVGNKVIYNKSTKTKPYPVLYLIKQFL